MRVTAIVFLLVLGGCHSAPAPTAESPHSEGESVSMQAALNPSVIAILEGYPTDGSYGFHWPKEGTWEGTTQDVIYAGTRLTTGDPQRRSFCCGLTFEVYVRALLLASDGPAPGVTAETLHELRLRFFGDSEVGERRRLCQFGLESLELGEAIVDFGEARAGDFVQFWRHSGSGHSAVFMGWVREEGQITGLRYWSTQSSTDGIGYNTESVGEGGIKRDEIYLVRARRPS